jgi:hypothetical protein
MHWGIAGYACRIATLTQTEERAFYEWSTRRSAPRKAARSAPPDIADRAPLAGSFVDSKNALRFFSKNGDPELERWAQIMFQEVRRDDVVE